jgi:hypothetical protein
VISIINSLRVKISSQKPFWSLIEATHLSAGQEDKTLRQKILPEGLEIICPNPKGIGLG